MFARMENIKLGKMFEDDPTTLNDVEKALGLVNIKLRDSAESFRPLGDVMDEVAVKWNTMNEIEQSAVANAIAGVRQRENFIALMVNYDEALKAQTLSANAAGLADERYAIYLNSVEAAQNKFKASWEGLWQTTVKSDLIKMFYNLSAGIMQAITAFGGIIPLLSIFIGMMVSIKSIQISKALLEIGKSFTTLFAALKTGMVGLTAFSATNIVGVLLMVTGLVAGIISSIPTLDERIAKSSEKLQELSNDLSSLRESKDSVADLWAEMDSLREKTSRSADENKRLKEVYNELKSLIPSLVGYYDAEGNFIADNGVKLDAYNKLLDDAIAKKRELIRLQAEETVDDLVESYEKENKTLQTVIESYEYYEKAKKLSEETGVLAIAAEISPADVAEQQQKSIDAGMALLELYSKVGVEAQEDIRNAFANSTGTAMDFLSVIEELAPALTEAGSEGEDSATSLISSMSGLKGEIEAITQAQQEQNDAGYISNQTAIELINSNATLAQYLTQTANGYLFDAEAARQDAYQAMYNAFAKYNIAKAAIKAAEGNYTFAMSAIASAKATQEEKDAMVGLLTAFAAMNISVGSVGGASAAMHEANTDAQEAEIDAINDHIDALENQKDALKDLLKAYKKIIDAKKESLRLDKEEKDYKRELEKKNKDLAQIDNALLALQFDNSEEANKKRLELEEERAEKSEEIAEFQADRTYDIQIEALDREYAAYEEWINAQIAGIDRMIDAFRAMIEEIQKVIDKLREMNQEGGGGGGYSGGGGSGGTTYVATNDPTANQGIPFDDRLIPDDMGSWSTKPKQWGGGFQDENFHSGGLVESHHDGRFAGGLNTNEVFAKLIKGEFVATESQMRGFMNQTLPALVSTANNNSIGNINLSVNVAGNLDKVGLADIKMEVFSAINMANKQKGKKRNVSAYSI